MARVRLPRRKARRPGLKYRRKRYARGRKMGYFRLVRRVPETLMQNSSTIGVVTSVPAGSSSVVQYGTPVATNFTGYYNVPGQITFKLSDIINPQDITNLFDKYRLKWIKIACYCTSSTASVASTAQLPSILWNYDEDDGQFPTPSVMREKMGTKSRMLYPGRPITMFVRPKVATSLNLSSSLTSIGNAVTVSPWINCTYDAVPHFGVKFALLDVNLNTTASTFTQYKWDIQYCIEAMDAQ